MRNKISSIDAEETSPNYNDNKNNNKWGEFTFWFWDKMG